MLPLHQILLLAIVVSSIVLMLVRPWKIAEVYWVGGGALLLIALRLMPLRLAGRGLWAGTDVYLFLFGMMLISGLARDRGVFDWLAAVAVRGAKGSSVWLFSFIYLIGTAVTIFMSNDATAVVLTPCILTAVRKAKVEPLPHLFACALIANAASFVLPISNPANLVVFHNHVPPVFTWLAAFGVPSLLSILGTYGVLRLIFRAQLTEKVNLQLESAGLTADGKLVLFGIFGMVVVLLIASACKTDLGLPACVSAVVLALSIAIKQRANPLRFAREISWSTLLLVGGLFVLVEAVKSIGALSLTQAWLAGAEQLIMPAKVFVVGAIVAVANNLVNNLPLGLIAGATLQAARTTGATTHAVLLGVDLGPNLSITGSLATILWLLALHKEKIEVGFWKFFKVGVVVMPVGLILSLAGVVAMRYLTH